MVQFTRNRLRARAKTVSTLAQRGLRRSVRDRFAGPRRSHHASSETHSVAAMGAATTDEVSGRGCLEWTWITCEFYRPILGRRCATILSMKAATSPTNTKNPATVSESSRATQAPAPRDRSSATDPAMRTTARRRATRCPLVKPAKRGVLGFAFSSIVLVTLLPARPA